MLFLDTITTVLRMGEAAFGDSTGQACDNGCHLSRLSSRTDISPGLLVAPGGRNGGVEAADPSWGPVSQASCRGAQFPRSLPPCPAVVPHKVCLLGIFLVEFKFCTV